MLSAVLKYPSVKNKSVFFSVQCRQRFMQPDLFHQSINDGSWNVRRIGYDKIIFSINIFKKIPFHKPGLYSQPVRILPGNGKRFLGNIGPGPLAVIGIMEQAQ